MFGEHSESAAFFAQLSRAESSSFGGGRGGVMNAESSSFGYGGGKGGGLNESADASFARAGGGGGGVRKGGGLDARFLRPRVNPRPWSSREVPLPCLRESDLEVVLEKSDPTQIHCIILYYHSYDA